MTVAKLSSSRHWSGYRSVFAVWVAAAAMAALFLPVVDAQPDPTEIVDEDAREAPGLVGAEVLRERCKPTSGASEIATVNILLLLDGSLSLNSTDPDRARLWGVQNVVTAMRRIQQQNEAQLDIQIALSIFRANYQEVERWQPVTDLARRLLSPATRNAIEETRGGTNYVSALEEAALSFGSAPVSGCNLLLWFTDGEHDLDGSGSTEADELAGIEELCRSSIALRVLDENSVTTFGVILSQPGQPADQVAMTYLFADLACGEYALRGGVTERDNADGIAAILDELTADAVLPTVGCEAQFLGEDDDCGLPEVPGVTGELPESDPDDIESQDEWRGCSEDGPASDAAGNPSCVYSFTLTRDVQAFRLHVDATTLYREILNPDEIGFAITAPNGERWRDDEELAVERDDAWQAIPPFGFWAYRAYDSRWQIIGHFAALGGGIDDWVGEWQVSFFGRTQAGAEDAKKIAALLKTHVEPLPELRFDEITSEGALTGVFLTPEGVAGASTSNEEADGVYLRVSDSAGELYYPTRNEGTGYLDPEPLMFDSSDNRFRREQIAAELVRLDDAVDPLRVNPETCEVLGGYEIYSGTQTGENGEVPGVVLRALLRRSVSYGPDETLLAYRREIGELDVTEAVRSEIDRRLDEVSNCQQILEQIAEAEALSRLIKRAETWEAPSYEIVWTSATLDDTPVVVEDGQVVLQWGQARRASLEDLTVDTRLRVAVGDVPWRFTPVSGVTTLEGDDSDPADCALNARGDTPNDTDDSSSEAPEFCFIDLRYTLTGQGEAPWGALPPLSDDLFGDLSSGEYGLREPPPIWPIKTPDGEVVFEVDVDALRSRLNDVLPADALYSDKAVELREEVDAALTRLSVVPPSYPIVIEPWEAEFSVGWDTPVRPRDPIWMYLIAGLLFLAVGLRVLRAWRVRRWDAVELPSCYSMDATGSTPGEMVVPELTHSAARADMGEVQLKSLWLPPLLGRKRKIVAVSVHGGDCVSDAWERTRKGAVVAVIGERLAEGWCATRVDGAPVKTLVWGVPPEASEAEIKTLLVSAATAALPAFAEIAAASNGAEEETSGDSSAMQSQTEPQPAVFDTAEQLPPIFDNNNPLSEDPLADDE